MAKYIIGTKYDSGRSRFEQFGDEWPAWKVRDSMRFIVLESFNSETQKKMWGRVIEVLVKIDKDIWRWKDGTWKKEQ